MATSTSEATSSGDLEVTTTAVTTSALLPMTSSGGETTAPSATTSETSETSGDVDPVTPDLPVDPPWAPLACETDEFEPNDAAMLATPIGDPCSPIRWDGIWSCLTVFTACHGPGDEDWYALAVTPEPDEWSMIEILLWIVPELSECNCNDEPVPTGPELASTVEIYDAQTLTLIGEVSGTEPYLWLYEGGPEFSKPLLIRVIGPADGSWTYDVRIWRRDSVWEDSCEC